MGLSSLLSLVGRLLRKIRLKWPRRVDPESVSLEGLFLALEREAIQLVDRLIEEARDSP